MWASLSYDAHNTKLSRFTGTNQQQMRGRHRIKYTEEREDNKTQVRAVNNR